MDQALVIAGTSFVGRHLASHLRSLGIAVRATSRTPQPDHLICDLLQPRAIDAILTDVRPRWVFHCAGATAQGPTEDLFRLHRDATAGLLDAVRRIVPAAVVVLFGSAAEYGPVAPDRLPITEDLPPQPQSPYGHSKLEQTRLAERMAKDHGLKVHVVRPFNLLGPGLGPQYLASALCDRLRQAKAAGQTGPIPVVNGQATRDFLDVRDAADAVARLAMHAPPRPGKLGLYNLATGKETTVLALADHLCKLAGDFHAVDLGPAGSRSAIDRSAGDATRLRMATGWRPRLSWQESVRAMWEST